jgi:hypothetical protein
MIAGNHVFWDGLKAILQMELSDSGRTRSCACPGLYSGGEIAVGEHDHRILPEVGLYADQGIDSGEPIHYPASRCAYSSTPGGHDPAQTMTGPRPAKGFAAGR